MPGQSRHQRRGVVGCNMITRAQVARRLGKSIATVRRLEGHALHPCLDDSGVHRFDPEEVERLRQEGGTRTEPAAAEWLQVHGDRRGTVNPQDSKEDKYRETIEHDLRAHLTRTETHLIGIQRQLDDALRRERELHMSHRRVLRQTEVAVCGFVQTLSPRQARQVGIAKLEALLKALSEAIE
jgi:hypothetical protein